MPVSVYSGLTTAKKSGRKKFAILIDPDKVRLQAFPDIVGEAQRHGVDYFFIGGSLILNDMLDEVLVNIREKSNIPLVLFPGSSYQLSTKADAILFLSLISGRNAELLIGKQVITAPFLKASGLEVMPTGYILVDGGVPTTVSYISNTQPVPADKNEIAYSTALAGELLGLRLIFLDAGSGARNPVSPEMVRMVSGGINIPLIVGGGIRTTEMIRKNLEAGADLIVIGDAIEKNPGLISPFSRVFAEYNQQLDR